MRKRARGSFLAQANEDDDALVEPVVVPVVAQPASRAATHTAAVAAFIRITDFPLARPISRGGTKSPAAPL